MISFDSLSQALFVLFLSMSSIPVSRFYGCLEADRGVLLACRTLRAFAVCDVGVCFVAQRRDCHNGGTVANLVFVFRCVVLSALAQTVLSSEEAAWVRRGLEVPMQVEFRFTTRRVAAACVRCPSWRLVLPALPAARNGGFFVFLLLLRPLNRVSRLRCRVAHGREERTSAATQISRMSPKRVGAILCFSRRPVRESAPVRRNLFPTAYPPRTQTWLDTK